MQIGSYLFKGKSGQFEKLSKYEFIKVVHIRKCIRFCSRWLLWIFDS